MTDSYTELWLIELRFSDVKESLKIRIEDRIVLGRTDDTEQPTPPHVDLQPYEAENHGVSRHHAAIAVEGDRLMLTDLNSGNGTMLNGSRLEPDLAYPLLHDDEIVLGNLKFSLQIIISPSYGSSIHNQKSIQLQDQIEPGKGQTVLIVEDDVPTSRLLAVILERSGYVPVIARDVSGAIRLFRQKRPSLVLLDIMLPDINGLELCRYIRRDTLNNHTPIVAISANRAQTQITNALNAGADIFLGKPINSKELRHVVYSLVLLFEEGVSTMSTKHLIGTAPLTGVAPETRQDTAVLFIAGHSEAPMTVRLRQPITLGRQSGNQSANHIDLSRYEAVNLGVSRSHAVLWHKNGSFYVRDLGSVNGTYLNGEPIKMDQDLMLNNADEIRLGQLRLYVYFLTDEELNERSLR
jgi:CheY-like chemotaxis protein